MIKVSVIIPIFNMEQFLVDCLDSVVCQTLNDIEIICINDGSTDNSLRIIEDYKKIYNNIIVISQNNLGVGNARNVGISTASGEYLAFMDPDDYYPNSNVLEIMYYQAQKNNAKVVGGSLYQLIDGKEEKRYPYEKFSFVKCQYLQFSQYQFVMGFSRFIYQKRYLIENNIYFPNYARSEDIVFCTKALICVKSFFAIPDVVYIYRIFDKKVDYNNEKNLFDVLRGNYDILQIANNYRYEILINDLLKNLMSYFPFAYRAIYYGNNRIKALIDEIYDFISNELQSYISNKEIISKLLSDNEITFLMDQSLHREQYLWNLLSKNDSIVIYGAGVFGKRFFRYLREHNYQGDIDFVVSEKPPFSKYNESNVYCIDDYSDALKWKLVFIAVIGDDRFKMQEKALGDGFINVNIINAEDLKLWWGCS